MKTIDSKDAYFTQKGIIPEAGEEITSLWGARIANSMVNSIALIGTVVIYDRVPDFYWVNHDLQIRYQFPPHVQVMFKFGTSGWNYQLGNSIHGKFINWFIMGDSIGFQLGEPFTRGLDYPVPVYVVYKLHGV